MKFLRALFWMVTGLPFVGLLLSVYSLWGTPEATWLGYAFIEIPPLVFLVVGAIGCLFARGLRRKWLWVAPAAATLLTIVIMGQPCFGASSRRGEDLRVMTYNIFFGQRGMDEVAALISAQNPDVVCLQECYPYRPDVNPVETLKKWFPKFYVLDGGDTLILSKFPILDGTKIPFPGNESVRPLLRATIDVRGTRVCVLNGHFVATLLDLNPGIGGFFKRFSELGSIHQRQIATVLESLPETEIPTVVCGDFNHVPLGKSYRDMKEAGFTDAFAATSRGFGGTLPSEFALKRIDYIWSNSKLIPLRTRVPNLTASDHRPVVAEFAWNR